LEYFPLGLDNRQSGENRVAYAMGAKTEPLPR